MAESELAALLTQAGIDCLRAFEEEELTPALLRSMSDLSDLAEIGCTAEQIAALERLLHAGSAEKSAEADTSAHDLRVRELQDEFFADDLYPPASAAGWSDEEIRAFFESGGQLEPAAVADFVLKISWKFGLNFPSPYFSEILLRRGVELAQLLLR